jgi:hypothetical protein
VTAVRLAVPLLAALVLIVPVACGGKDDEQTAEPTPLTLQQQLLAAEDAPGSKPDPVEKGGTTADFDEFMQILNDVAIDPDLWNFNLASRVTGAFASWNRQLGTLTINAGIHGNRYHRDHFLHIRPDLRTDVYSNTGEKSEGSAFAKAQLAAGNGLPLEVVNGGSVM